MTKLKLLLTRLLNRKPLQQPENELPFVEIKDKRGNVVIADRLTVEYLQSKAPHPSQRSVDKVFEKVTRVRLLNNGMLKGKALGTEVLLDISDADTLASLRECLTIVEDESTFGHCMCLGDQALELYAGQQLVATIGLHHGESIRWDAWKDDAQLKDGRRLLVWLADQGVKAPLEAYEADQSRAEEYRQAAIRWQQAMPRCLLPFWKQMANSAGGMVVFAPLSPKEMNKPDRSDRDTSKLKPLFFALEAEFPDLGHQILEVFRWYGSGKGPWSGYPAYEQVAEELLLVYPTSQLVAALTRFPLTPTHLEGAARFLAGYAFNKYRPNDVQQIPQELKQKLLAQSLESADQDRIQRAKKAFAA